MFLYSNLFYQPNIQQNLEIVCAGSIRTVFCFGISSVSYSDVFRAEYYQYYRNIPSEYAGIPQNVTNIPYSIPKYRGRNIRLFPQCRNHNNINRFADFNRAVNNSVFIHIHSFIYSFKYSYMLISARHVITFKKKLFLHFARFKSRQHFPDRLIQSPAKY